MMRAAVAKIEGECGLRIDPAIDLDAGGGTARRASPIGSDRQTCRQRRAAPESKRDLAVFDLDSADFIFYARKCGQLVHARFQCGDQNPILDVVAEGIEPDLACRETCFRRPQQPSGVVDDPQHPQRRGLRSAPLPDAQRVECLDRACEQRTGAVIGIGAGPGDERGLDSGAGKRDRRGQAGRPTAHNEHFERLGHQRPHFHPRGLRSRLRRHLR